MRLVAWIFKRGIGGAHGERKVEVAWGGEAGAVGGGHACGWGMEMVGLVVWVSFIEALWPVRWLLAHGDDVLPIVKENDLLGGCSR